MTKTFGFELIVRVALAWLVSSMALVNSAAAHEVQPGVMDVEISSDTLDLYVEWILEAPIAGLDLEGVADTNEAEGAEEYDRLRGFEPEALAEAFNEAWPELKDKITVNAGDAPLDLNVADVDVPEVGDVDLARTSTVHLTAALPADGTALVIGWSADLGPLVVRQRNVDGGYAGYLVSGALSDPIPR